MGGQCVQQVPVGSDMGNTGGGRYSVLYSVVANILTVVPSTHHALLPNLPTL